MTNEELIALQVKLSQVNQEKQLRLEHLRLLAGVSRLIPPPRNFLMFWWRCGRCGRFVSEEYVADLDGEPVYHFHCRCGWEYLWPYGQYIAPAVRPERWPRDEEAWEKWEKDNRRQDTITDNG